MDCCGRWRIVSAGRYIYVVVYIVVEIRDVGKTLLVIRIKLDYRDYRSDRILSIEKHEMRGIAYTGHML